MKTNKQIIEEYNREFSLVKEEEEGEIRYYLVGRDKKGGISKIYTGEDDPYSLKKIRGFWLSKLKEQKESFKKLLAEVRTKKNFANTYHAQCCKLERDETVDDIIKKVDEL